MNPPDGANSINWTIEFREMKEEEEGSGNSSDFDPSRCGHVDEYYHQVRKDLAGRAAASAPFLSDIQPCLIWGRSFLQTF